MILDRFEVRRRCSTEMIEITEWKDHSGSNSSSSGGGGSGGGGGSDEEKGARWGKDSVIIRHRLEKLLPDPEIDSLALELGVVMLVMVVVVVVVRVGENDGEEEGKALNSASNAKGPLPSPQIFIH
ncbi:hypothetical protein HZH66_007433 [Vespula vulgaris]|uniref:Uncharacterized protein n=1 Tax=Vespula vulgaris TaxID=7454 RepID=A0A834K3G4_VESVU|nr:hypothetical protein HZH66_007433 [Vespula vulgaris]